MAETRTPAEHAAADKLTTPAKRLILLPVSKATGGLMPGVDLTRFSDYQEMEDPEYVERMKRFK
jgi:hypothetical protein